MSEFQPSGRISVNFNDISLDPILENGDKIFIPTKNEVVTVLGEVLNNNSFLFKSNLTIEDYINKAGGLTEKANEDNIYIIHSNGEAEKYENSYFFGDNIELNNGDTIIIPPKLDISSYREIAKDVSQILYQFAITAISLKTIGAF
jgi:protein involved in polysaccharide export with SLBB domain